MIRSSGTTINATQNSCKRSSTIQMLAKMKNQLQKEYGVSAIVSEVTDMLFLKLVLIYPLQLQPPLSPLPPPNSDPQLLKVFHFIKSC